MELAEIFKTIPAAVSAITAVVFGIFGVVNMFRAKDYKNAFGSSEKVMLSIIAAIELLPSTSETQKIKEQIRKLAEATGAEAAGLAEAVKLTEDLFSRFGISIRSDAAKQELVAQVSRVIKLAEEDDALRKKLMEGGK